MNNYLEILGIPKIEFAHYCSADCYTNVLPALPGEHRILEVAYILEGSIACTFPNGEIEVAPPHSVLCTFRHEEIEVRTEGRHEHHTVCFDIPLKLTDEENPNGLCLPHVTQLPQGKGKILSLIDNIIFEHTVHVNGDISCSGLFLQLLGELNKHNRHTRDEAAYASYKYIKKAKEYIFAHLSEPIYQTDIARHLDISPEYLCSVFKKSEGIPIMQFINRVKLEQIRNIMRTSNFTLAQASELYGYSDPNYVSRLHKKYFQYNITDIKK